MSLSNTASNIIYLTSPCLLSFAISHGCIIFSIPTPHNNATLDLHAKKKRLPAEVADIHMHMHSPKASRLKLERRRARSRKDAQTPLVPSMSVLHIGCVTTRSVAELLVDASGFNLVMKFRHTTPNCAAQLQASGEG
jgi:hypothetical protein